MIWKIEIKNGKFVRTFDAEKPKIFEPQYIVGNGWECKITPSGTTVCTSENENGILKFVIFKNGFSKLTLK